jgi:hypothetical protein
MVDMQKNSWFYLSVAALAIHLAACSDGESVTHTEEPANECMCPLEWNVDNITVCGVESTAARPPLVYSTVMGSSGPSCGTEPSAFPAPLPKQAWSKQRIRSTCAGSGQLCFRLRQGDAEHPTNDDCVLAEHCTDFTYKGDNKYLELPPIDAWTVSDTACAYKFEAEDGYLEFANDSDLGCEPVVQRRLCPLSCAKHSSTPECQACLREVERTFTSND